MRWFFFVTDMFYWNDPMRTASWTTQTLSLIYGSSGTIQSVVCLYSVFSRLLVKIFCIFRPSYHTELKFEYRFNIQQPTKWFFYYKTINRFHCQVWEFQGLITYVYAHTYFRNCGKCESIGMRVLTERSNKWSANVGI